MLKALYPPIIVAGVFMGLAFYHPIFIIGYFVMVFDIAARAKEYTYLLESQDMCYARHKMSKSWCSRAAAIAAIPEMKEYYNGRGYRWWHVFPDGFPLVFLKLSFWKSVVGLK